MVMNNAKVTNTEFGGLCWVPMAFRSMERTIIIRTNDVDDIRKNGMKDNAERKMSKLTVGGSPADLVIEPMSRPIGTSFSVAHIGVLMKKIPNVKSVLAQLFNQPHFLPGDAKQIVSMPNFNNHQCTLWTHD